MAFLPTRFLPSLVSPDPSPTAFLQSLSSGQLLCVAYNACVRHSRKPWGYISTDAIHDIVALQEAAEQGEDNKDAEKDKKKREWTFRRTDNLRLWGACVFFLPSVLFSATKNSYLEQSLENSIPTPYIHAYA